MIKQTSIKRHASINLNVQKAKNALIFFEEPIKNRKRSHHFRQHTNPDG